MIIKAKDLRAGDELIYQGELHRVTANDPDPFDGERERKILTYVIARPRTAPFIIWWANDESIEVERRRAE